MKTLFRLLKISSVFIGAALPVMASATPAPEKAFTLDLDTSLKFIDAARALATSRGAHVAIAIVDQGGRLVAFEKMDGTQLGSVELAMKKAESAVNFARPTADMEHALDKGNFMIATLPNALPAGGGYPIMVDHRLVGALGLSGGEEETDAHLAQDSVSASLTKIGAKTSE